MRRRFAHKGVKGLLVGSSSMDETENWIKAFEIEASFGDYLKYDLT